MEIRVFIVDAFSGETIHNMWTEHSLVPIPNDTINIGLFKDFVVARREFQYCYDDEYGYQALCSIVLYVYEKPINKEG